MLCVVWRALTLKKYGKEGVLAGLSYRKLKKFSMGSCGFIYKKDI